MADVCGLNRNTARARRFTSVSLIPTHWTKETLRKDASDEEARKVWANAVDPLLEFNKCPDFVVNRGHYFGTSYFKEEPGLTDQDKHALIEFLKTF